MTEKINKTAGAEKRSKGYILRLTYSKTGLIRFISHRDLIRVFFRGFSRAGLPVAYSRGYSPHPRVSFCPPLKVGMEGLGELLDLTLTEPVDEEGTMDRLNAHLPEGLRIRGSRLLDPGEPSLNSRLEKAEYRVGLQDPIRVSGAAVEQFLTATEVLVKRKPGDEAKIVNARRGVLALDREGAGTLRMVLSLKENGRPYPVLAALLGVDSSLVPGLRWQRLGFGP
jgi:radical SAM-linked protein